MKDNFIKENWGQLIFAAGALLALGKTLNTVTNLQQQVNDLENGINKMVEYLNGEDDGVRGDFENADKAIENLEQMRERATTAELKLWFYEKSINK